MGSTPPLLLWGCVVAAMTLVVLPPAASAPDLSPQPQPQPPLQPPADRSQERSERRPPSCEEARLKCAYRTGCGRALQSYIVGCSSLHHSPPGHCPETCQQALIALTSTDEGKDLMTVSASPGQRL